MSLRYSCFYQTTNRKKRDSILDTRRKVGKLSKAIRSTDYIGTLSNMTLEDFYWF